MGVPEDGMQELPTMDDTLNYKFFTIKTLILGKNTQKLKQNFEMEDEIIS